jgi:glucose-6-phosphate dehydrogenase assembly protein OpcA
LEEQLTENATVPGVQPEKVLRDLHDLWAELGKEHEEQGGVLRACAMTLIAIAEDDADCEHVRQTLGELMRDHPSRAIVLRASEGANLSARVFAECWMPFGRNQQICAEGIEMTADAANLGEVAQLLLPLIVPDLPVVLWCRGARFFSTRYFDPLFPVAQKIIVDSSTASNAKGAIAVLRELRSRGRRVGDLAWTRLTGWREALAHVFDDAIVKPGDIGSIRIQCGAKPSTSELYFCRWIERSLPSARVIVDRAGQAGLCGIVLEANGAQVSVTMADPASLEVTAGGRTSRAVLPAPGEDALMRDELAILEPDPAFESVLT